MLIGCTYLLIWEGCKSSPAWYHPRRFDHLPNSNTHLDQLCRFCGGASELNPTETNRLHLQNPISFRALLTNASLKQSRSSGKIQSQSRCDSSPSQLTFSGSSTRGGQREPRRLCLLQGWGETHWETLSTYKRLFIPRPWLIRHPLLGYLLHSSPRMSGNPDSCSAFVCFLLWSLVHFYFFPIRDIHERAWHQTGSRFLRFSCRFGAAERRAGVALLPRKRLRKSVIPSDHPSILPPSLPPHPPSLQTGVWTNGDAEPMRGPQSAVGPQETSLVKMIIIRIIITMI